MSFVFEKKVHPCPNCHFLDAQASVKSKCDCNIIFHMILMQILLFWKQSAYIHTYTYKCILVCVCVYVYKKVYPDPTWRFFHEQTSKRSKCDCSIIFIWSCCIHFCFKKKVYPDPKWHFLHEQTPKKVKIWLKHKFSYDYVAFTFVLECRITTHP